MTLKDQIIARIEADGPLSIADYMATCLFHPTLGYYTTKTPFGQQGDFVTSPEISQMFGELIGLALVQAWLDQGGPSTFTLAELGPGRGTLMADALRAARVVPGFAEAAEIYLIEASPALRNVQRHSLTGITAQWIDTPDNLPKQPLFLIANEFFDALPIRQFIRVGTGWRERQIGTSEGKLIFGLGPTLPQPALMHRLDDTKDGDLVEDCAVGSAILSNIAQRISRHSGAALIIDYGDWRSQGDTLQAVKNHLAEDPLLHPGAADLTAHVDFEALALASAPCLHSRLTPQGVFMERLGITPRAEALGRKLAGPALDNHIAAHRRLTHPDEMGALFKVLGLVPHGKTMLPGLET